MSTIATIAHQIRSVTQQIEVLESEASQAGYVDPFLEMELNSYLRRCDDLKGQFEYAAREKGVSVCSYRTFGLGTRSFAKVCNALSEFQRLYSLIFSAIRNGPRKRRQALAEDEALSTFGFGYSFSGSIGVALTLAQPPSLFAEEMGPDSDYDKAMGVFCQLAKAQSLKEIQQYATDFGAGTIRELYAWCGAHYSYEMGADVSWLHGRDVTRSVLVQPQELSRLSHTIEMVSEVEESDPIIVHGKLLGADTKPPEFHFQIDGGDNIRGSFVDAITDEHPLEKLPQRYKAVIRRRRIMKYSTDEETVKYHLEKLLPAD